MANRASVNMNAVNQQTNRSKPGPRLVEPPAPKPPRRSIPWQRVFLYTALAAGFFLLGIIPMWVKARQYELERETAQQELRLKNMEGMLANAVINADRGDYEPARQMASDFFTSVRIQIERGSSSDLSTAQRDKVKLLMRQRDELITLLARSDPAAADRLSDLYVAYRRAMNDVGPDGQAAPKDLAIDTFHVVSN